jgi:preprotein translocase subunit SecF
MELFKHSNFDFLGKKWPFIILSLILTAAGLVQFGVKGGPRYGIDFRGRCADHGHLRQRPPVDKVRAALSGKLPVEVQEVTASPDDIIGIDVRTSAAGFARQKIVDSLDRVSANPPTASTTSTRVARPRWPIICAILWQTASVPMSDQQLQTWRTSWTTASSIPA